MTTENTPLVPRVGAFAFLCALTLAAFWPVFSLDFIRFDDTLYVTSNSGVRLGLTPDGIRYAATAIVSGNYHPLTVLSHQLDVSLFGLNPRGHHAVNLLFHVANVCLLFGALSRMTGAPWRSLIVAALFAVHPLRVESVAWVSERKDVLSTFFMFLTIGAYLKFVERRRAFTYARMLVWYALALLAKPMPVTLPFLLLLLDYWPLRRGGDVGLGEFVRKLPRLALEKLPLFALSAGSCAITFIVQRETGAVRGMESVSIAQRAENVIVAYVVYLEKLFAPTNLVPHYPMTDYATVRVVLCAAVLAVISVVAVVLTRKRPYVFTGWFWYLGTLVPVIGIVQVGNQAYADRYTYITVIGITVALVWLAADILARRTRLERGAVAACAIVLAVLSVTTFRQTQYWKNSITLFTRTIEVAPRSSVAHKVLGLAYAKGGDVAAALPYFRRAMELNPLDRDSAFNLGTALLLLNRVDESIPYLNAATTAYDKPADAYTNLGRALMQKNLLADARMYLLKALEIDPNQNDARLNLGIIEGMADNAQQSIDTLADVVRRAPDNADAHYNYGLALLNAGRYDDAARAFEEALRLRPNFPEAAAQLHLAARAGRANS